MNLLLISLKPKIQIGIINLQLKNQSSQVNTLIMKYNINNITKTSIIIHLYSQLRTVNPLINNRKTRQPDLGRIRQMSRGRHDSNQETPGDTEGHDSTKIETDSQYRPEMTEKTLLNGDRILDQNDQ